MSASFLPILRLNLSFTRHYILAQFKATKVVHLIRASHCRNTYVRFVRRHLRKCRYGITSDITRARNLSPVQNVQSHSRDDQISMHIRGYVGFLCHRDTWTKPAVNVVSFVRNARCASIQSK